MSDLEKDRLAMHRAKMKELDHNLEDYMEYAVKAIVSSEKYGYEINNILTDCIKELQEVKKYKAMWNELKDYIESSGPYVEKAFANIEKEN